MNRRVRLLKIITALGAGLLWALLLAGGWAMAAGGGSYYPHDPAPVDVSNKASLQRGARLFVNYCQSCHSMEFQRYSRLAADLDLPPEVVTENLILTAGTKIGDTMISALPVAEAKDWFGAPPPDLSLIARSRGADYLYNYLRGFYRDDSRMLGVNNSVFPLVGMPHVLWQLQGWQTPVYNEADEIVGFDIAAADKGSMTPSEFSSAMGDLVNFLVYVGEPIQQERKRIGIWVILYLLLALVVFYLLKKEYWKDVH